MSNNYKKSMDKIILSDELKNKIVQDMISHKTETHAAEKYKIEMNRLTFPDAMKQKIVKTLLNHKNKITRKRFRINFLANITACLILFIIAASTLKTTDLTTEQESENPNIYITYTTQEIADNSFDAQKNLPKKTEPAVNESSPKKTINKISVNTEKNPDDNINDSESESENDDNDNNILSPADIPEQEPPEQTPQIPSLTAESSFGNEEIDGFLKFDSADKLKNTIPYKLAEPRYMPAGYELSNCALIAQELSELQYTNGSDRIIYRTEPGSEDCSGNYNSYSSVKEITLKNITASLKTDPQKGFLALWSHDGMTYSLDGSELLTENDIIKIIKNIM